MFMYRTNDTKWCSAEEMERCVKGTKIDILSLWQILRCFCHSRVLTKNVRKWISETQKWYVYLPKIILSVEVTTTDRRLHMKFKGPSIFSIHCVDHSNRILWQKWDEKSNNTGKWGSRSRVHVYGRGGVHMNRRSKWVRGRGGHMNRRSKWVGKPGRD